MDLGILGAISLDWTFFSSLFSIVIIDLILAGDNAVVIAMAIRELPPKQRKRGIIFGAGAAVLLRVIITFFVSQLLLVNFLKLVGGIVILWIAIKLFVEGSHEQEVGREVVSIGQAIRIILIADITMSTDNMLAVAGASHGNLFLLLFGLALSIPFVVFTSNLLVILMDRYPVILYFGAAVLGRVGGEMIITDPVIVKLLAPSKFLQYSVEVFFALAVIVGGKLWMRWKMNAEASKELAGEVEVSFEPEKNE